MLWQSGRPDPRNGLLTNDTPFQIHDLDGDGRNEVVLVKDFKLQVLDGRTGKVSSGVGADMPPKCRRPLALAPTSSTAATPSSSSTSAAARAGSDIVVKDRYRHFWVFRRDLKLLWQGQGMLGHYPYPWDPDGDGRDDIAIGYALLRRRASRLWSHDGKTARTTPTASRSATSAAIRRPARAYYWGSDEGFLMFDLDGNILKHVRVGHAQTASVGKFRPDLPGLQYVTVNFWKNPGIVSLFDPDGNSPARRSRSTRAARCCR